MPKNKPPKIIVIVGPTASGKSDLAIKIARKFNGEIISADSRQVYRGMNVGTGKVLRDRYKGHLCNTKMPFVSAGIRHYLIDVADPKKQFTVDDFKKLGQKAIGDILSRGKTPIIVGGTGFYIDVLLGRMAVAEVPPNKKLRARFDKLTVEHLFKMLQKLDPKRARTVEPKNKRRLIRALEIIAALGKVPSPTTNYPLLTTNYDVVWIGLKPKNLEKRIKKRLDARLKPSYAKATADKQGMIKEVIKLHKQGLSWKRLDELGLEYRWISRWLIKNSKIKMQNGPFDKTQGHPEQSRTDDNAKFKIFKKSEYYEKLLGDIIKYSKRQMTWFKRNKEIKWLTSANRTFTLSALLSLYGSLFARRLYL